MTTLTPLRLLHTTPPEPTPQHTFSPHRLISARELRGYDRPQLADALNIPIATLARYETGQQTPSFATLRELGATLHVRTNYFTTGRPAPSLDIDHFTTCTQHRHLPPTQQRKAFQLTRLTWEIRTALTTHINFPAVGITDLTKNNPYTTPETAAHKLRHIWQLGWEPIKHLVRLLETKGILVTDIPPRYDLNDIDACALPEYDTPTIMLNPTTHNACLHHRRDAAARALAHLVMPAPHNTTPNLTAYHAQRFATEFLAPSPCLKNQLTTHTKTPTHLTTLSNHWGIPLTHLIDRCPTLGHITTRTAQRWQQHPKPPTTTHHTHIGEQPMLLQKALTLTPNNYTTTQLAHTLHIPTTHIDELTAHHHTTHALGVEEQ